MRQFDFGRHWRKRIAPILVKPLVQNALNLGMSMQGNGFIPGGPPFAYGRPLERRRPTRGTLAWYQPLGCCHYIAPFSYAIAVDIFPDLKWSILTGKLHTVVVGYDASGNSEIVMDILHFNDCSAEESIALAKHSSCNEHWSLTSYFRSFVKDELGEESSRALRMLFNDA